MSAEPAAPASVTGPVGWHFVLACSLPFLCLCCPPPPVHPHPPLGPWSSKGLNGEPPGAQSVALPAIGLSHLVLHKAFAQAAASRQLPQEKRRNALAAAPSGRLALPVFCAFIGAAPSLWSAFPSIPLLQTPDGRPRTWRGRGTCPDHLCRRSPLCPWLRCDAMRLASSGPDAPPCSSMAAIPLHSLEVEASSPSFSHSPLDSFIYSFICSTNMNPGMSTFTTWSTGNTVMSK